MIRLAVILLFVFAVNANATEYFVGKSGSDVNSCATAQSATAGNRKLTVQAGVNCATTAGDIVTVGNGTYSENTVSFQASGAVGNPITLRGENDRLAIISSICATSTDQSAVGHPAIWTNGKSNLVIGGTSHGLVTNCGDQGILVYPGSSNVSVINNEVKFSYDAGILYYAGSNNGLAQNNLVHDNGRMNWPRGQANAQNRLWPTGMNAAENTSGNCFIGNVVYWNHGEGIAGTCLKQNIASDNWSVNLYVVDAPNGIVDRNFVYNTPDGINWTVIPGANPNAYNPEGIAASTGDTANPNSINGMRVTNNIVVRGYRCFDRFISASTFNDNDVLIANNTCVRTIGGIDYQNTGTITNVQIKNNILEGAIDPSHVSVRVNPVPSTSTFSNNWYNTTVNRFYWGSSLYTTLGTWAAVSGEVNSTSGTSPQLVDSTVNPCRLWADVSLSAPCSLATLQAQIPNYYIQTTSGPKDAGVSLSSYITTDYAGVTRPSGAGWDIGAKEFVASGSAPSISIVSPSQTGSYSTTASTVDVSGLASDDVAVTAVTWACATCTPTSGTATGTTSWSQTAITLASGANTITFTASDGTLTSNAVITVTKSTTPNAPVLHLRMSEGSGSTLADISGAGNDGTHNCTWSSQGKHTFGIQFDGSCSITVPDDVTLLLPTGFSLEGWVFPTTSGGGRSLITKNYDYYLYSSINGWCGGGNAVLGGFVDVSNRVACDAAAIPNSQWTHLAVTYDGATIKLYKNGTLINSTAYIGTVATNTGSLQIGNNQFSEGFVGVLDDIFVYNYAIDAAQILTDMEDAAPPSVTTKIGSGTSIKVGAGSSMKIGQ